MGASILISGFWVTEIRMVGSGSGGEPALWQLSGKSHGHRKRPQSPKWLRPVVVFYGRYALGRAGIAVSPSCAPVRGKLARVTSFPQFLRKVYWDSTSLFCRIFSPTAIILFFPVAGPSSAQTTQFGRMNDTFPWKEHLIGCAIIAVKSTEKAFPK